MKTELHPPPPLTPAAAAAALSTVREALQARRWAEAQQQAEAALNAGLNGPAQGEMLLLLAQSHWWLGHLHRVHRPALRAAVLPGTPGLRITALGLAALALSELGLADEALPLALQGLELARQPAQHEHLSGALSRTAHVHARLGDLESSELLHMQALSMAREASEPATLLQAYCNLLLSCSLAHEELQEQDQTDAARAALERGLRHLSHARSLLLDARLDGEHRAALELALGRLLLLAERLDEAEPLLQRSIAASERLSSSYYLRSARQALAELYRRRGRPAEALVLLEGGLLDPERQPGLDLQIAALRSAQACQQALSRAEAAAVQAAALHQALAQREAMRRQARQSLEAPSQFGTLEALRATGSMR
ncbi:MAG TPA: tetratricopeptide repeat protein [Roseateles sp.]|nr:tetratricopeptide repeat protein [Roseateles sp.]